MPGSKSSTKQAAKRDEAAESWTEDEREAMRERARELKASKEGADGEADLMAKIAEMPEADRIMAERIHAIVKASAPDLVARTWYGMPAYAKDDKVVCFFQPAGKFKARYSVLGFNDTARLDAGAMWPTSYAVTEMTAETEARIAALVKQAIG